MENNKNKKSVKFQGDMLNFYEFIQVFVFTTNHHLNHNYLEKDDLIFITANNINITLKKKTKNKKKNKKTRDNSGMHKSIKCKNILFWHELEILKASIHLFLVLIQIFVLNNLYYIDNV